MQSNYVTESISAANAENKEATNKYNIISKVTRQSSRIFGLGEAVTAESAEIRGSKLPTCEQVLRCLMYHIQQGSSERRTRWQSAKMVLSKVAAFYDKANIPMISEGKACERMIALLDANAKIRAIHVNRRSSVASLNKLKEMQEKLNATFRLWPLNVEQLMKNKEDSVSQRSKLNF